MSTQHCKLGCAKVNKTDAERQLGPTGRPSSIATDLLQGWLDAAAGAARAQQQDEETVLTCQKRHSRSTMPPGQSGDLGALGCSGMDCRTCIRRGSWWTVPAS